MTSWHSYPKVYALGHAALRNAFDGADVHIEEKIDGSQFSFGVFSGELKTRSHNREFPPDAPDNMFALGAQTARELAASGVLHDGWTYRAEYLNKPHHNGLAYDRVPRRNVILFDVSTEHESYLPPSEKAAEAERIGLECVPYLYAGPMPSAEQILAMLDRVSVLGGQNIEGVAVKRYDAFTEDGHCAFGKFVSEKFKEVQKRTWTKENPCQSDILEVLGQSLRTEARWLKAAQHLAERGQLTESPKDIGPLMVETQADVLAECEPEIAAVLLKWALPHLKRKIVAGLPEWWKRELLRKQCGGEGNGSDEAAA